MQRRFVFGRVRLDGIIEVFNVFNRANYGSYITQESNANYGAGAEHQHRFAPRMLQLGFRAAF